PAPADAAVIVEHGAEGAGPGRPVQHAVQREAAARERDDLARDRLVGRRRRRVAGGVAREGARDGEADARGEAARARRHAAGLAGPAARARGPAHGLPLMQTTPAVSLPGPVPPPNDVVPKLVDDCT